MTAAGDVRARLRTLADVLPALESSTAADFGTWVESVEREPGDWTMPYVEYGPTFRAFQAAVGQGGWVRSDVDWRTWIDSDEARELLRDPVSGVASATPYLIACIVTSVVRGDRFNEGSLLRAFESGHLTGVARRAKALADDPVALETALAADARRGRVLGDQARRRGRSTGSRRCPRLRNRRR